MLRMSNNISLWGPGQVVAYVAYVCDISLVGRTNVPSPPEGRHTRMAPSLRSVR